MATYRYIAEDDHGQQVTGQIEATDRDQANRLLRDQGLDVQELAEAAPETADAIPAELVLSGTEADELTQQIARVGASNLPMSDGLRAAAEESFDHNVAAALRQLADRMDRGETLETILNSSDSLLPRPLAGLVLAAAKTGSLGSALAELADHQRTTRYLRSDMWASFAYPLIVLGLTVCLFGFVFIFVVSIFSTMFEEFGLQLPMATQILLWWHDTGIWILFVMIFVASALAIICRLMLGRAGWLRMFSTVPLFGSLTYWTGISDWSGLLSVLLKHGVPLPEALRFAGHGIRNDHIGEISLRLAEGVSRGRTTSEMIAVTHQLPTSLVPIIRWGEKADALAESFSMSSIMFERRVRNRAGMLQTMLPPILFVLIGCSTAFIVCGLFLPLIDLISQLS